MAGIDPRYYYVTAGLLALCTLIGLVVAYRFQREVEHDLAPPTEKDLFEPLEQAYYSGLMDEAEFVRIREARERLKPGSTPPTWKSNPSRLRAEAPGEVVPAPEPDTEPDEG